jgi:predicted DNA-binding transcriptional regulator AlpA
MACSRAENNCRNPVPRVSWTVDEFCASVGISRSTYEKAKRDGWGPRELILGSTGIRIAEEARAEWIASREKAAAIAAKRRDRQRGHAVAEEENLT